MSVLPSFMGIEDKTKDKIKGKNKIIGGMLLGVILLSVIFLYLFPADSLQLIAISPRDGLTDVSTLSTLKVRFNQNSKVLSDTLALSFSPPLSGSISWADQELTFSPAVPLKFETTYAITLTPNVEADQTQPLAQTITWQFRTGALRILYLAPDEQAQKQLFAIPLSGGEAIALTKAPFGILDYTLSPDGSTIVYAALNQDEGSDLWTVTLDERTHNQVLMCAEITCSSAKWSPDGTRLVYSRRVAQDFARIWYLDMISGKATPAFADTEPPGFGAVWSFDGQWLSYVAPLGRAIRVYNPHNGRSIVISTQVNEPAVWSPQSNALLMTDVLVSEGHHAVQILHLDLDNNKSTNLSDNEHVDDGSPVWSPDGAWIAFNRKPPRVAMGKQLWLMRSDGTEAHHLTDDPIMHNIPLAWSPDGRFILVQRINLQDMVAKPSIWVFTVANGMLREVLSVGEGGRWLP